MGHHYVPQKYLEGFCDSDGQIYQYTKGSLKPPAHTWPRKVAQQSGFYSPELEKKLNLEIEIPANRILAKLRSGRMIAPEDKSILAQYMVNLIKRTPKGWARFLRLAPKVVEEVSQKIDEDVRQCVGKSPQERLKLEIRWEKGKGLIDAWGKKPSRDIWHSNLEPNTNPKTIETLTCLVWRFYFSDKPVFLTCDNPVFFDEAVGIGKAISIVTFPISSYVALEADNVIRSGKFEARREDISRINQNTINGATRFIYHCEDSQSILQLINGKKLEQSPILLPH